VGLGGPVGAHSHHKHANSIMIRYVEDIYADYLYDCYIANQRLTEEEWLYYGKEEHHIEVPNRDGGLLTPLNSQHLTTYQHWVAGVLQSEMLQKVCFAFMPKDVLPTWMEDLRLKWLAHHHRLNTVKRENNRHIDPDRDLASKVYYSDRKVTPRSISDSKRRGKPVGLQTPEGEVIIYDSLKLACRHHGLHPGHLREVIQGKRPHHKGYTAWFSC
jgi:hypothetical protein